MMITKKRVDMVDMICRVCIIISEMLCLTDHFGNVLATMSLSHTDFLFNFSKFSQLLYIERNPSIVTKL